MSHSRCASIHNESISRHSQYSWLGNITVCVCVCVCVKWTLGSAQPNVWPNFFGWDKMAKWSDNVWMLTIFSNTDTVIQTMLYAGSKSSQWWWGLSKSSYMGRCNINRSVIRETRTRFPFHSHSPFMIWQSVCIKWSMEETTHHKVPGWQRILSVFHTPFPPTFPRRTTVQPLWWHTVWRHNNKTF